LRTAHHRSRNQNCRCRLPGNSRSLTDRPTEWSIKGYPELMDTIIAAEEVAKKSQTESTEDSSLKTLNISAGPTVGMLQKWRFRRKNTWRSPLRLKGTAARDI
jgi:hypothetical protein